MLVAKFLFFSPISVSLIKLLAVHRRQTFTFDASHGLYRPHFFSCPQLKVSPEIVSYSNRGATYAGPVLRVDLDRPSFLYNIDQRAFSFFRAGSRWLIRYALLELDNLHMKRDVKPGSRIVIG
jgi:hypothetical protein